MKWSFHEEVTSKKLEMTRVELVVLSPKKLIVPPTVGDKAVNAEVRATLCDGEEPVFERMQDRHRERERERERHKRIHYFPKATVTITTTTTFTKGYKVTLYSD